MILEVAILDVISGQEKDFKLLATDFTDSHGKSRSNSGGRLFVRLILGPFIQNPWSSVQSVAESLSLGLIMFYYLD